MAMSRYNQSMDSFTLMLVSTIFTLILQRQVVRVWLHDLQSHLSVLISAAVGIFFVWALAQTHPLDTNLIIVPALLLAGLVFLFILTWRSDALTYFLAPLGSDMNASDIPKRPFSASDITSVFSETALETVAFLSVIFHVMSQGSSYGSAFGATMALLVVLSLPNVNREMLRAAMGVGTHVLLLIIMAAVLYAAVVAIVFYVPSGWLYVFTCMLMLRFGVYAGGEYMRKSATSTPAVE